MASGTAVSRLQKELKIILRDPVPYVVAQPLSTNLLEWRAWSRRPGPLPRLSPWLPDYVLLGNADSDYAGAAATRRGSRREPKSWAGCAAPASPLLRRGCAGGVYWGKLIFPSGYPFKPPSILMLTPSGRFAVNTRLCLSMSDFHPESWNPMWSVSSILSGLQSFFYEETPTTGAVQASKEARRLLAAASLEHNARVPLFGALFPDVLREQRELRALAAVDAPPPPPPVLPPAAGPAAPAEVAAVVVGEGRGHGMGRVWVLAVVAGVLALLALPFLEGVPEL